MTAQIPQDAQPGRLRVLIVEDEMLLAMVMEDTLVDFGCEVVGPVARVADGVRIANSQPLDGAILDINLAGATVFPVAQELAQRNIPFLFISGYGDGNLPQEWRNRPRLQKPIDPRDLAQRMASAFSKTRL